MYIFWKSWGKTHSNQLDLSSWETENPQDEDSGCSGRAWYDTEEEFLAEFNDVSPYTKIIDLRPLGKKHLNALYSEKGVKGTYSKFAEFADTTSGYRNWAAYEAILESDLDKDTIFLSLDAYSILDKNKPACSSQIHKVKTVEQVKELVLTFIKSNKLSEQQFFGGTLFKNGYRVAETNYLGDSMVSKNGKIRVVDTLPSK